MIGSMYEKKIKADGVDDKLQKNRDTLYEFVLDFFGQQYGTVMSSTKMKEFGGSLKYHLLHHNDPTAASAGAGAANNKSLLRMKWFYIMNVHFVECGWKHE